MSAAPAAEAAAPAKGTKKLIIIVAAVLVLALAGGGAFFMMKKKAHAAEEGDEPDAEQTAPAKAAKHDPKVVPVFVPLEPFTVNLADRDAERYAQVGITLEVEDAHTGETIKQYMPAIRNNILLALADKTAAQLMERDGKNKLAQQLRRETARAMGYEVEEPAAEPEAEADAEGTKEKPKKKKAKKAETPLPITAVQFSNFIIQ